VRARLGHLDTCSVAKRSADPGPEGHTTREDAEEEAEENEEGRGAGSLVDEKADDEATDDGTDEETTEAEQVATAQPGTRRGSEAVIVHSPAPIDWLRSTASFDTRADSAAGGGDNAGAPEAATLSQGGRTADDAGRRSLRAVVMRRPSLFVGVCGPWLEGACEN